MKHLNMTVQIAPNFSADEWQLYGGEYESASALAALELNAALATAVNAGKTRDEVETIVGAVMDKHSECGACDTEPDEHLFHVLNKVYGRQLAFQK
jgi:hypothetical protein